MKTYNVFYNIKTNIYTICLVLLTNYLLQTLIVSLKIKILRANTYKY